MRGGGDTLWLARRGWRVTAVDISATAVDTRFPAPQEVHAELGLPASGWTVERADAPAREVTGPDGQTATVTDHVLLLRRTPR